MWLQKLFIIYLLTLFNSMDGYFLDNQIQSTGRHRRKDSNDLKNMHKNSLSPVHTHFITKNSTRVISQRGGLAILPCSVTMSQPATVSKYLYF
ncbi:unnamed protein product [Chironomus riparius]|uniref:Secreted protein n=1 Tax=Chironomus riparius TaxID=315576 RepID=A0A9N9RQ83_9DIPT|nr:unnamed protein product [Chironomus riparius]